MPCASFSMLDGPGGTGCNVPVRSCWVSRDATITSQVSYDGIRAFILCYIGLRARIVYACYLLYIIHDSFQLINVVYILNDWPNDHRAGLQSKN